MDQVKGRGVRGERGFGFLQLLIIVPIILAIMSTAASYFYQKLTTNMLKRARENFSIHHQNMKTDLGSPMAWEETVRLNPALSCMETETCGTLDRLTFTVYSINGKPLSGPESPGYRADGTVCASVEDECPVKWHFQWRPMCPSLLACPPESEIEFTGELTEPATAPTALNLDKYKIVIYQKLF